MIESWWDAHAFEFVLSGILLGIAGFWGGIEFLLHVAKERRKKRKDGLL